MARFVFQIFSRELLDFCRVDCETSSVIQDVERCVYVYPCITPCHRLPSFRNTIAELKGFHVLLVIFFGTIKITCFFNGRVFAKRPPTLNDLSCYCVLFLRVIKNSTAILGTAKLRILGCMKGKKQFHELLVRNFCRVKSNANGFGVVLNILVRGKLVGGWIP